MANSAFTLPAAIAVVGTTTGASDAEKLIKTNASGLVDPTFTGDASITYAKIQNVSATDKLLGRSTAGAGVVEEIACTAAGRALLDDVDAAAQRTTLELGTAAVKDTGTSGNTVPLLDGANTWSQAQTFSESAQFTKSINVGQETETVNMTVSGTASMVDAQITGGAISNTPISGSTVAATTLSITEGAIISGTYTPTLTNVVNLAGSTAYQCQYMRVGGVVTVSGKVDIDPTATGACELGISLPIASAFTLEQHCGGTAAQHATQHSARINADTTNDRAQVRWTTTDTSNRGWGFQFTYLIVT